VACIINGIFSPGFKVVRIVFLPFSCLAGLSGVFSISVPSFFWVVLFPLIGSVKEIFLFFFLAHLSKSFAHRLLSFCADISPLQKVFRKIHTSNKEKSCQGATFAQVIAQQKSPLELPEGFKNLFLHKRWSDFYKLGFLRNFSDEIRVE
jgi:hypothetical protein